MAWRPSASCGQFVPPYYADPLPWPRSGCIHSTPIFSTQGREVIPLMVLVLFYVLYVLVSPYIGYNARERQDAHHQV